MAVYWCILVLSAAAGIPLCGLYEKRSDKRAAVYCILMWAVFSVTAALRFDVGVDYNMYAGLFYDMNFMDMEQLGEIQREKGMLFPVVLTEIFTFDYFPAFAVLSPIIYALIMTYGAKYSDVPWAGVFAFLSFGVFFNSLNFMRQVMATAIGAFALRYWAKGNYFRFAVFSVIAGAFHRSAFLLLPFGLICLIPMNIPVLITLLCGSCGLFAFSGDIISWVTGFVYKNYGAAEHREITTGLSPLYTVMYGVVFIGAYLLKDKLKGDSRETNQLLWCSYGGFFFEALGMKHAILSRIALLFFLPVVFLLLPRMLTAVCRLAAGHKGRRKKAAVFTAAAFMAVMTLLYGGLLYKNYNGVVPYRTVFEREVESV
ncbi:MAG: EpsG family protein [Ruminococcus sp.]|nr:EpsG family protein [Ruminococcus sp.]